MGWRRFNGERIDGNILDAVRHTVEKEVADGYRLKVCIGTDSQVRGSTTEYATVIVFLREKKG
ncbi:MAG TPA: ribonuclease H-like YkuK family protein, partial [Saprospiraceae bacterium]|nr:ribonuclease H-like YkuK family protein [Saprospiraceae bacterium]